MNLEEIMKLNTLLILVLLLLVGSIGSVETKNYYSVSIDELTALARKNDTKAQVHLGFWYEGGFGVTQDYWEVSSGN